MIRLLTLAPAVLVAALITGFALVLLREEPTRMEVLTGQPLPSFMAEPLASTGKDGLDPAMFRSGGEGAVVLNVWASWCAPCRTEHPQLMRLAEAGVPVHGLVWRDSEYDALEFLEELGDPFTRLGVDPDGRAGQLLGVQGAPETLIVGADGVVAAHIRGPLTPDLMGREIVPKLRALGAL